MSARYEVSDGVIGHDVIIGEFSSHIDAVYGWIRCFNSYPLECMEFLLVYEVDKEGDVYSVTIVDGKVSISPMKG